MKMVTTNIQEIQELFAEVLQKVEELVGGIDKVEEEMKSAAQTLLREAIRVAMPTLKYVDDVVEIGPQNIRAVTLDEDVFLARDGTILQYRGGTKAHFEEYCFYEGVDEAVDKVIVWLTALGKLFNEALSRMDERREHLATRSSTLQAAAEVFKK